MLAPSCSSSIATGRHGHSTSSCSPYNGCFLSLGGPSAAVSCDYCSGDGDENVVDLRSCDGFTGGSLFDFAESRRGDRFGAAEKRPADLS